jgi:hypothetical protein
MKKRTTPTLCLCAISMLGNIAAAQTLNRAPGARVEPCLMHTSSDVIDTEPMVSLEMLVQLSQVIVVGKVVNVLPAVLRDPRHPWSTQTDSLVLITERLRGALPAETNTITLTETGGTLNGCGQIISDDPLVRVDEQYVLFLTADKRTTPPNTSGSPRYAPLGIWAGKARIVNGKIQFVPAAHSKLHKYDNMDQSAFTDLVKERIQKFFPGKPHVN